MTFSLQQLGLPQTSSTYKTWDSSPDRALTTMVKFVVARRKDRRKIITDKKGTMDQITRKPSNKLKGKEKVQEGLIVRERSTERESNVSVSI